MKKLFTLIVIFIGFTTLKAQPAAPVATAATNVSYTSFTANWNSVAGATSYRIDVSSTSDFANISSAYWYNFYATGTSAVISSTLTPNATYYYRVRAVGASGTSANSNVITLMMASLPPTPSAATNITTSSFTASWTLYGNAYYGISQLDIATDANFTNYVSGYQNKLIDTYPFISRDITGLSPGTTYYYRLRSVNTMGYVSGNSSVITVATLPDAPVATAATNVGYTSFTANWNSVAGATSYRIDVSDASDFSNMLYYNNMSAGTGTSATINMTISTYHTYYYRVRAVGASGTSANSNVITTMTLALPPTPSAATNITTNSFDASWTIHGGTCLLDMATDANFTNFVSGYQNKQVYGYTLIGISGLSSGTTYYYRLRSVNALGYVSGNSGVITVTTLTDAPIATAATNVNYNSFTANWNSVVGATSYRIDVSDASDFSNMPYYNNSYAGTGTSVTISTTISINHTYYYRVRAVGASGTSANSNVITLMTASLPPTPSAATNITTSSFTASWTLYGNAYYGISQLDIATDANFTNYVSGYQNKLIDTYPFISRDITGLSPGTTYYYRLRSVNTMGYVSGNSGVITVTTLPDAPVATAATSVNPDSFIANWNTVVGASSYQLDVALTSDFSNMTSYNNTSVSGNSKSITTGISPNTTYYYRVRAVDASGASANSNVIQVTTVSCPSLSKPTGLSAGSITQVAAYLSWAAVSGATGYKMNFTVNYGDGTYDSFTKTSTTNNYSLTNLEPSSTYQMQVVATFGTCTSASSSVLSFTTLNMSVPTGLDYDEPQEKNEYSYSFKVHWNAVVGATAYQWESALGGTWSSPQTTTGTSYTNPDAYCGLAIYYKVRAISAHHQTNFSSDISVWTPACPADGSRVMATAATKTKTDSNQTQISSEVRDITAYPNPTSDIVTVAIPWVADEETPIVVMDVLGKELSSFVLQKGTWKSEISTKNFSDGIYFIKVAGSKSSVRVVVKH